MILFRPEMAEAIVRAGKTVTRRRWRRPRVRVGAIHLCYTRPAFARPPGKPFARVRIVNVSREVMPFTEMPGLDRPGVGWTQLARKAEAGREGFDSEDEFRRAWFGMHGGGTWLKPCYRVAFELVEVLEDKGD